MQKIIPLNASLIPNHAKPVFKGIIFEVYHWQQKMFDGSEETFEMLKRPDTVQVICVNNNEILLLNEEQPHLGKRTNFPCGRVDATDKTTLDAAKRELLEETGIVCESWCLVDVKQPYMKTEWFMHTYIATEVSQTRQPKMDPGEKIKMKWFNFNEIKDFINSGHLDINNTQHLFKNASNTEQLLKTPQYKGVEVDR